MSGETKWKSLGTGALIGITASTISAIGGAAGASLGYSPMGFKNFVKVAITTGVSSVLVFVIHDELAKSIMKRLWPPG